MKNVTKETAVMLKENGFDLPSREYYDGNVEMGSQENNPVNWNKHDGLFSAPTLYEACTWLREVKGVHVYASVLEGSWCYDIQNADSGKRIANSHYYYLTHDLALEAGIVHALKHYVK